MQEEFLGQSEHGPSRNFVFEDRNRSGKAFENWVFGCFLLWFYKMEVLSNLPQTVQFSQMYIYHVFEVQNAFFCS